MISPNPRKSTRIIRKIASNAPLGGSPGVSGPAYGNERSDMAGGYSMDTPFAISPPLQGLDQRLGWGVEDLPHGRRRRPHQRRVLHDRSGFLAREPAEHRPIPLN